MQNLPNISLAIPVKNCSQFIMNLCKQIENFDYPKENLSITFLENDSTDNSWTSCLLGTAYLSKYNYKALNCCKYNWGYNLSHTSRHLEEVQEKRLECIAKSRQMLVDISLRDNDYLYFIDADCVKFLSNTLQILLEAKADIVVPILVLENGSVYDYSTSITKEGKIIYVKDMLEMYPNSKYIKVDVVNAPFMARREVFEKVKFDLNGKNQEGPAFSAKAIEYGYNCYASLNCPVIHANIASNLQIAKNETI